MRCAILLLLILMTTPARASGTLFANDLALQCSSQEREKRLICEAFVDGFLAGLSTDGNACPTPEASEETIAALLAVPQEQLGRQEAGTVLERLTADRYACH
jgi:hypothetical protein